MKKTLFFFIISLVSTSFCLATDLVNKPVLATNDDGSLAGLFSLSENDNLEYIQYDKPSKDWATTPISLDGSSKNAFVKNLSLIKNSKGALKGAITLKSNGKVDIYAYKPTKNDWQKMPNEGGISNSNNTVFASGVSFSKDSFGVVAVTEAIPTYTLAFYKADYDENAGATLSIDSSVKQQFELRGIDAKSDILKMQFIYNKSKLDGVVVTSNTIGNAGYVNYCKYSTSSRDRCEKVARYNHTIESSELVYGYDHKLEGVIVKAGPSAYFLPYSRGAIDGRNPTQLTLSAWDTVDDIYSVTSNNGETVGVVAVFKNGLVKYLPHSANWRDHIWKILRNASTKDYIIKSQEFSDSDDKNYLFLGGMSGRVDYLVAGDSGFKSKSWVSVNGNGGEISSFAPFFSANGELESVDALFLKPFSEIKIKPIV